MNKPAIRQAAFVVVALAAVAYGWQWWQSRETALPPDISYGNGRIEADQVDIATKYAGRVQEILAHEGDLVQAGDVLARMDTAQLDAQFAQAVRDGAAAAMPPQDEADSLRSDLFGAIG